MKNGMHLLSSGRPDERANTVVEFALVAPVLIFAFIGLVDYAIYVSDQMRLSKAVASAVQFAMYNSDNDDGIRNVAYSASYFSADQADVTITHACECPNGDAVACDGICVVGDHKRIFVEVAMRYTYTPLLPYPFVPESLVIDRSASIQIP
jgi:hypothetical protein